VAEDARAGSQPDSSVGQYGKVLVQPGALHDGYFECDFVVESLAEVRILGSLH
jgi:hypothetical protein